VLSVTHQRTVKVGQPPIWVDERNHRILSATGSRSVFGGSVGVVCHASAHCESWATTNLGK